MRQVFLLFAAAAATPAAAQEQAGMDHGAMDHGAMDHAGMDHGVTGEASIAEAEPDTDHSGMDHSAKPVSDQPGNASAPAVPADHAADAVFGPDAMARSRLDLLTGMRFTGFFAGLEKLEYRAGAGKDGYSFEGTAMYGGDIDRIALGYRGEGSFGERPEEIELDAYWRHAAGPWFNLQLGVRHDFQPGPERNYAMIGIEGLAPYWIEIEAQAFLSEKGDLHVRGSAAHAMRLTQKLVFEPEAEIDVALQDVPEFGIGSGFEKLELSGRMRYEINPAFAPYVGFSWERKLGRTADFARAQQEDPSRLTWLAGVRFWF